MPINIPKELPAREVLENENIFVMDVDRARSQDIRPLNILILNLMPEKEKTEAQLLRLLGNTPLQVNISFLHTATHESRNVSKSHLEQFYTTFEQVRDKRIDGMIITGAPVERMDFEGVNYWDELKEIMDWAKANVTSMLHICWGAQAALYHYFGIGKFELPKKCSGIYRHTVNAPTVKLMRGFDDIFYAPHSRYTDVDINKIEAHNELELLASSEEAGAFMIMSKDERHIMVTGHLEYDAHTLAEEYERDLAKGLDIDMPENYFPDNNPTNKPLNRWRSHAHLLFSNWLNYYVYQETPYEWK
ncbi:homoserine O-acetyltransferase MetA [Bacillus thermotolerans]|uniref:Homoserine O-acetyltransferase n=1 Tax=Bacillus thermotolerans TaxID=1221996 RepID=A0A0F5HVS4_BACTR|nr:homoserine O-succinyltransferase [Bacillus thermotolerans]KKB37140.1 Homoserine O-succinyltransferase [Bacillus thermotolerans]KKB40168.1 Homoserine O-succinyltransferase [Bacillus thermotolerans]KKB42622.1 Homoserine O-succinyltransferase [Bacillus thermotolerans]